jgi:hypothetical protein
VNVRHGLVNTHAAVSSKTSAHLVPGDEEVRNRPVVLGCNAAQGYFMSRPLPTEPLTHWVDESPWRGGPGRIPEPRWPVGFLNSFDASVGGGPSASASSYILPPVPFHRQRSLAAKRFQTIGSEALAQRTEVWRGQGRSRKSIRDLLTYTQHVISILTL